MSVSLDNSLKTFEEKVSPSIKDIPILLTTITTKLNELTGDALSTVTNIGQYYNGDGMDIIASSFNSIKTLAEQATTSINQDLGANYAINTSNELIEEIKGLRTIIDDINDLEVELTALGDKREIPDDDNDHSADKAHNQRIEKLTSEKEDKESAFSAKQSSALGKLDLLKKLNIELTNKKEDSTPEDTTTPGEDYQGTPLGNLEGLKPGSYTKQTYNASNGKTITYWIYVPENVNTTTGLPVTLYMAGGGERGSMINSRSLPNYLSTGASKPNGIVICLQADNENDYNTTAYLDASKELCDSVVTTYKADTNRISISGHSVGGRGALAMAARYPDYFSVCVPVSGLTDNLENVVDSGTETEVVDKLSKTHIVGITGTADMGIQNKIKQLLSKLSGKTSVSSQQGYDHNAITNKYVESVEIEGKTYSSLLEYLFSQTRA